MASLRHAASTMKRTLRATKRLLRVWDFVALLETVAFQICGRRKSEMPLPGCGGLQREHGAPILREGTDRLVRAAPRVVQRGLVRILVESVS